MTEWLLAIEGTPTATRMAMILALISALFHAIFGSLQKGRYDPWIMRGAIDFAYLVLALPVALFLVPWPSGFVWLLLLGAFFIHIAYKMLLAMAYSRGAFTVVYPIVRGVGPLATVAFAFLVFEETFTPIQWLGVGILSGGIYLLALYNVVQAQLDRGVLLAAIGLAAATGVFVALYTTYDAYGIRATPNPFTFLAWFFVIDGLAMPWIGYRMYRRLADPPDPVRLLLRGFIGALIAFVSFGGVMMATRLDKVGEAAVLRETSVIFAAFIGWVFLKETVGPRRLAIIVAIAIGAVLVEFGA